LLNKQFYTWLESNHQLMTVIDDAVNGIMFTLKITEDDSQ